MNERIYLCLAHMSGQEMKYIQEAFDTNWVVPLGPNVNGFEQDISQYINSDKSGNPLDTKNVVALSSGTAAVHLALVDLGVSAGDEVICQSFTFCASSNPVLYQGAIPVLVDSEDGSWNMNPELMEKAIQDRIAKTGRKPKAIIVVHLYGMPAQMERIMEIAGKYEIPVVEDAAEAFGSRIQEKACGTWGDYGILSFNGNKMITTSGGGALVCKDADTQSRIMFYATQAREAYPYYQHEQIGFNYRMSNICAGIGRGQMSVLNEHIVHHQRIADLYQEAFAQIPGIEYHATPLVQDEANYWLSTILLGEDLKVKGQTEAYNQAVTTAVGGVGSTMHAAKSVHTNCEPNTNVEAMRVYLDKLGIESRPLWKPMHLQPLYTAYPAYVDGTSERIFKCGLCLPSGPMVTDEHIAYIVQSIKDAID